MNINRRIFEEKEIFENFENVQFIRECILPAFVAIKVWMKITYNFFDSGSLQSIDVSNIKNQIEQLGVTYKLTKKWRENSEESFKQLND